MSISARLLVTLINEVSFPVNFISLILNNVLSESVKPSLPFKSIVDLTVSLIETPSNVNTSPLVSPKTASLTVSPNLYVAASSNQKLLSSSLSSWFHKAKLSPINPVRSLVSSHTVCVVIPILSFVVAVVASVSWPSIVA